MQQRLVRAKRKIRHGRDPVRRCRTRSSCRTGSRAVLASLYLIFNEGYLATSADTLVRRELCDEAIRLGRVLASLMPAEREALGPARADAAPPLAPRRARRRRAATWCCSRTRTARCWHRDEVEEGLRARGRAGAAAPYAIQAAIAAEHARAATAADDRLARASRALYARLEEAAPSAVVTLNRAVAVAMADGPAEGLRLLDELAARGELDDYQHLHSARGGLLRRLGRDDEDAAVAYAPRARARHEPGRAPLPRAAASGGRARHAGPALSGCRPSRWRAAAATHAGGRRGASARRSEPPGARGRSRTSSRVRCVRCQRLVARAAGAACGAARAACRRHRRVQSSLQRT